MTDMGICHYALADNAYMGICHYAFLPVMQTSDCVGINVNETKKRQALVD